MGASVWSYFVPYQPDIQTALDDLRYQVFDSRKYYKLYPLWKEPPDEDFFATMPEEIRDSVREWAKKKFAMPEPSTIEELIEYNAEEGTHSILDIDHVALLPEFGAVAPLSDKELEDLLGTTRPTHALIEKHSDTLQELRDRWQGTYIIVYKDDQPDEIFFTGFSGD